MDLFKAILLGAALIAIYFAIWFLIAMLLPLAIFAGVVLVIWFLIKASKHDGGKT